jgi:hypothetical protein
MAEWLSGHNVLPVSLAGANRFSIAPTGRLKLYFKAAARTMKEIFGN